MGVFYISRIKKVAIHIRTWTKLTILIVLATIFIIGILAINYKPIYTVVLDGEQIGYTANKSELQSKINSYIEKGEGGNVAFVEISKLPQYELCLLKKDVITNDEEIFKKVIGQGKTYYKYYAIALNNEEKAYVETYSEAESIVNKLKEKNSSNKEELGIVEKYETENKEFTAVETVVADLYKQPVVKSTVTVAKQNTGSSAGMYAKGVNESSKKVNIGISLIKPISGTLTSRFGARWGKSHKGIDIGASKGTPIKAAASGTVTTASTGYNGGYGNYIVISHGNGVQTAYGHCNSISVSVGQKVSQGQVIGTVGNTGNSQGNHLHLEIRVNGVAQNPQNYVSY